MAKNTIQQLVLITAIGATTATGIAQAHEKGDIILRAGPILAEPQEESDPIGISSPDLGLVPGAGVGVNNDVQLGLTATYMITDKVGVEVLAATPFSHEIYAADGIAGVGKLGDTNHLPPTVSVQYFLAAPDDKLQPYVGVGINYTTFFNEETNNTLTGAVGTLASLAEKPAAGVVASSTELKLDDSVGVAVQGGMDYAINEHLGVNAAVWWIDIDTKATITAETNVGTVTAQTDVKIDPLVYFVSLSYTF